MKVIPYIGSKERIYPLIKPLVTRDTLYVEPFSGGFSLGLELIKYYDISQAHLNDLDGELYNFWSVLKDKPDELLSRIFDILQIFTKIRTLEKDQVNEIFQTLKTFDNISKAAITYIYRKMNLGMVHEKVNLTFGYREETIEKQILEGPELLQMVTLSNKSFQDLKHLDSTNTFWLLDPPYVDTNNANYYKEGVNFSHEDLKSFISNLQGRFLLTYDDTDYIRDLYEDFNIIPIRLPSNMTAKGYTDEVFITNFPLLLNRDILLPFAVKELKFKTPIVAEQNVGLFIDDFDLD